MYVPNLCIHIDIPYNTQAIADLAPAQCYPSNTIFTKLSQTLSNIRMTCILVYILVFILIDSRFLTGLVRKPGIRKISAYQVTWNYHYARWYNMLKVRQSIFSAKNNNFIVCTIVPLKIKSALTYINIFIHMYICSRGFNIQLLVQSPSAQSITYFRQCFKLESRTCYIHISFLLFSTFMIIIQLIFYLNDS